MAAIIVAEPPMPPSDRASVVLEYFRVFLSAHMVICVAIVLVVLMFKSQIVALLNRISKLEIGGAALYAPQQLDAPREQESGAALSIAGVPTPVPTPNEQREIAASGNDSTLTEALASERARARYWEFRFLGFYLAPMTQFALDYLASDPRKTRLMLLDYLQNYIPSAQQRLVIFQVLESYFLVRSDNDLITVSEKGREYLDFRGPLSQFYPNLPLPSLHGPSP